MTAVLRRVPPLARPPYAPEMTPLGFPYCPPPASREVALMPLIMGDDFDEIVREFAIPPCSVSLATQAGTWSARHSRSGFAPGTVLASFADDPDEAMGPLVAAGIAKRAKKGGMQIINGHGLTVVNKADDEAERDRVREAGRERSQRLRDRRKAERAEAIRAALPVTAGATREAGSVTPTKRSAKQKPQVTDVSVTRYESRTSRVTPGPSHARADFDLDFDLDQSPGVSQVSQSGVINAGAREEARAVIAAVIDAVCAKDGRVIDAAEAAAACARIRARPKTPRKLRNPVKYFTTVIENEEDLYAELLDEPPPLRVILSEPPPAPAGALHEFVRDPATGACAECEMPRSNTSKHAEAKPTQARTA